MRRIQRTSDWKPSKSAVWVGPRSSFYNPFAAKIKGGESGLATMSRQILVDEYREWLLTPVTKWPEHPAFSRWDTRNTHLMGVPWEGRPTLEDIRSKLKGKDLVCRCHDGQPCHADVLLELANGAAADSRLDLLDGLQPTPYGGMEDRAGFAALAKEVTR